MKLQPRDLLHLSASALSANKLRSGLTMLGITIGVFSVVGVMTALTAVRQSIDSGLSFFAANVFEISKFPPIQFGGPRAQWWQRPNILPRQALEFARRMRDEEVPVTIYAIDRGQRIRSGERRTSPTHSLFGVNENFLLTHRYEIATGRAINAADLEFNRPVVVLGADIVKELFHDEDPVGLEIVANQDRYTVVGTLEPRGTLFGNTLDNIALVPITRFVATNWNWRRSMEISVLAPSALAMGPVQDIAIGHFRAVRGLRPGQDNDFEIYSNESLLAAFARIADVVGTGGLLISAIALLCAGVGIMNIMLVNVTERTPEIGLRKSIGARRRDILLQFLLEAVALALCGGLVGIVLGWGAGNLVAARMGVPMIIPWFWIGAALAVCSAIGVGFGFFPALRAARMRPVEALRYE